MSDVVSPAEGFSMPAGLGARGGRFWRQVTNVYELSDVERELLVEVARMLDVVERLDEVAREVSDDPDRLLRVQRECRQQRLAVAKLAAQLELPDEDGDRLSTPTEARARRAAQARWKMSRKGA